MNIKRPRMKPVVETQMISLADIAFLIIFFFLLTSSFMRDSSKVQLPVLPKEKQTASPTSVTLDADHTLKLNGQQVRNAEDLENGLRLILSNKKDTQLEVRFMCDKKLTYKDYGPIYDAIGNAGGVIAIMHDVVRK